MKQTLNPDGYRGQMLLIEKVSNLSRREYLKWAKPLKLLEPRLGAPCHVDVATPKMQLPDTTDTKDIPLVDVVVVATCSPDVHGCSKRIAVAGWLCTVPLTLIHPKL